MPSSVVLRRACAAALGAAATLFATTGAAHAAGTVVPIKKLGTVDVRKAAANAPKALYRPSLRDLPAFKAMSRLEERRHAGEEGLDALVAPALQPPRVGGLPVNVKENQRGFEGLDIRDQVFSQGFETEPPDQGLCGGTFEKTTFLWEDVNLAISLVDTDGNQYLPPALGLNVLFGVPPAVDLNTGQFGPFLADPRCYFDTATGRWFHTTAEIDVDPKTGDMLPTAHTLIAVSQSADPLGPYTTYSIDSGHAGCNLCFGDQPLLGADANALFVSAAEYDLAPNTGDPGFFGAQIFAIDKQAMAAGSANPTVVHFEPGTQFTGTLQPATTPSGRFETAQLGTEYLLSAQDCEPPDCSVDENNLEDTIQLWAVTRTATIRTANPSLRLLQKTLPSQVYGQPHPQEQKDGFRPLGAIAGDPNPPIDANDARMNQVVYAGGRLWGGVNTLVAPGTRDGISWFQVVPSVGATKVAGVIREQGYVAAARDRTFVSFPSIGVNDRGRGVIAYTFMGKSAYPSAAQTTIDRGGLRSGVTVTRTGFKPEDGFTCYASQNPGGSKVCRWGDYSASFALPNGDVWSATEFIGDNARTTFANWSTFVWPVARP